MFGPAAILDFAAGRLRPRRVNGASGAVKPGRSPSQRGRGSLSVVSQLLMLKQHFFHALARVKVKRERRKVR